MAKSKAAKPHTKKIRTIALSVLLAIIVWFMVMSLTNPSITTTVSNLDVRFIGEMQLRDKELAITGRDNIPTLSVSVRGSRRDLMSFMDDIYVQVDVSNITSAGEYELTGTISIPTTRITVEKENYGDIPVTVEPLVSKDIEVTVKQTGVPRNKLIKSVAINPIVTITGAESEINNVSGAVATVDVSRVSDEDRQRVGYVLTDENGALVSGNETIESARAEIEVTNTAYDAKTLAIEPVLNPDMEKLYVLNLEKTTITPATVTVGVDENNRDDKVSVIIDRPADGEEQEYELRETEGMYIPPESRFVKVNPELELKEPIFPAEEEEINDGR